MVWYSHGKYSRFQGVEPASAEGESWVYVRWVRNLGANTQKWKKGVFLYSELLENFWDPYKMSSILAAFTQELLRV